MAGSKNSYNTTSTTTPTLTTPTEAKTSPTQAWGKAAGGGGTCVTSVLPPLTFPFLLLLVILLSLRLPPAWSPQWSVQRLDRKCIARGLRAVTQRGSCSCLMLNIHIFSFVERHNRRQIACIPAASKRYCGLIIFIRISPSLVIKIFLPVCSCFRFCFVKYSSFYFCWYFSSLLVIKNIFPVCSFFPFYFVSFDFISALLVIKCSFPFVVVSFFLFQFFWG